MMRWKFALPRCCWTEGLCTTHHRVSRQRTRTSPATFMLELPNAFWLPKFQSEKGHVYRIVQFVFLYIYIYTQIRHWYAYTCSAVSIITSSTAQGGGGNFKNRKPIGEIGCRESRMAERIHWWTEKWLECRTIYLSIHLSVYLPICLLSLSLSMYLSIYLPILLVSSSCLTAYPLSVYLPIHLSVFSSICLVSICLRSRISIKLPVLSVYISFFLFSLSRSIHFLVYLSVFPLVFRSIQILFKYPTPAIVLGNARQHPSFSHFWQGAQSLAPATRQPETTSERPKVLRARQFLHFWLGHVLSATTACTFSTSQLPKVLWPWCVVYLLIWKCASRHNCVHFFDTSTSKSAPTLMCVLYILAWKCASCHNGVLPKLSDVGVLCTFWLGNVLGATMACNFSSLIWPHGSAPAALATLLFDPPEPQIIGKTQCFVTFLPFCAPGSSFFWDFLFFDLLSSALLLSDSSHLCFSICPYCRKSDF